MTMRAFYGVKKLGTWTDRAVLKEGFQNFRLYIPFENRGKYANLHLIDPLHWGRFPIMQIPNCPTLAKVNGKRTRGTKASRDHDPADSPRSILTPQTFLCKSVFCASISLMVNIRRLGALISRQGGALSSTRGGSHLWLVWQPLPTEDNFQDKKF